MYQKILADPLAFGPDIGTEVRGILASLFNRDPSKRIGVNGVEEIKERPFFVNHIHFGRLLQKKIEPPFKSSVSSPVSACLPGSTCLNASMFRMLPTSILSSRLRRLLTVMLIIPTSHPPSSVRWILV
ncbi:uncharacterized protein BJ212DRAFT_588468 [Suillus subaureus]|uniref:Protein kinase domain-containing protein n=1 Tax=Suillus subaureus TaxID=48587 RepID=A0A9P7E4S5_9AGAM|nr:uncharacterized protein BJ212DRAFT_588468 [Suillus subaureus]KAG1810672.1 hypothetical protein BJ212DRAFT_588468 [Suillus subaureus]